MNQEFNDNNSIDTELQVRLMNLAMGEASDFDRDQLQLLMEQRAEVAAYYQHLEHLHGLLCQVRAGEPSMHIDAATSEETWQLSPDRREKVLAVLNGDEPYPTGKVALSNSTTPKPGAAWSRWWTAGVLAAAACVLVGLFLLPSIQSARSIARRFNKEAAIRRGAESTLSANVETEYEAMPSSVTGKPLEGLILPYRTLDEGIRDSNGAPIQRAEAGQSASSSLYDQPGSPTEIPAIDTPTMDRGDQPLNFSEAHTTMAGSGQVGMGGGAPGGGAGGMLGGGGYGNGVYGYGGGMDGMGSRNLGRESLGSTGNVEGNFRQGPGEVPVESNLNGYAGSVAFGIQSSPSSSVDYFSDQGRFGGAAIVPSKPSEPRFDNGPVIGLSGSTESPKSETVLWEDAARDGKASADELAAVIPLPSADEVHVEGRLLLGGINRLYSESNIEQSTVMRTVTPRIIIPEVDEKPNELAEQEKELSDLPKHLSQVLPADKESRLTDLSKTQSRSDVKAKKDSVAGVSQWQLEGGRGLKEESVAKWNRGEPGSKLSADDAFGSQSGSLDEFKRIQGESKDAASDWSGRDADFAYDLRTKNSKGDGATASGDLLNGRGSNRRGWVSPTLSPELSSRERARVELERIPAAPKQAVTLDEQSASTQAFSTFSLHVSDVSFKLAQAALNQGQWPEATKIRIEEFVNALDYHDPLPNGNQKVACRIEQSIHPFLMQRNLLRVSMRTAATGRSQNTPLRLTLLLDNSGSMERPDRRQAVVQAFQTLTQQLSPADQVTLISFARTPRLLADKVPGNQGESLLRLVENLPSEGGTNIEAALMLAREKATEQQIAGAQNRIVLLTDGAVNLGNANPDSLAKLVTQMRDAGIAFDAAGICSQDLNDEVLEALTRKGDGRYYLLDSAESASATFAAQIAGALRPSAKNVKVQVEFNPQRVGHYKLLGFEEHRLNKEDFRNDQVDAAEMAAAEAGVAVYQFEIKPNGSGDVGNVSVRFRDLSTGQMVERRWPIPYESSTPRLEQAQSSMQLAASAALFAAKLSGGPLADSVDLSVLQSVLSKLPEQFASQPRVQQLRAMIDQATAIGQ